MNNRSIRARTPQRDIQSLKWMADGVINGGRLKAAMKHAVAAFGIPAHTIVIPVCTFHKDLETRGVFPVNPEITGPLPPEDVPGRVSPGGAGVGLIAG